jgi:tetratricopeptide (TPR) repeat protein
MRGRSSQRHRDTARQSRKLSAISFQLSALSFAGRPASPRSLPPLRFLSRFSLRLCVSAVIFSLVLFAADKDHLAMLANAQAAFDRVDRVPSPPLADASACVQTQAAMLSVALPAEESEIHYRKGFCQLAVAAVTRAPSAFSDAAAELDRAGASMLAWLARRAGSLTDQPAWSKPDTCPKSCEPLVPIANLWLGWLELNAGNLDAASTRFSSPSVSGQPSSGKSDSGWPAYVAAARAFHAGYYAAASAGYRETLDIWTRAQSEYHPPLTLLLAPPRDIPQLLMELGGAQILAGDPTGAVRTIDHAVQASPNARAYFLRARAKELAGQSEAALADYNLASRAAYADATDLASGEAHLYRGILFFRRRDYVKAEEEFASALNFNIPPTLRPDAAAWRHLSAVASGFCGVSRQYLEQSLPSVSPYFPKAEAEAMAAGCS